MLKPRKLTKEQGFQKLKHYCLYQERCHKEVKEKLYSLGLWKAEAEEIMLQLIEADYLNEERFAIQYAGGKFRMKQWGRVKIANELKAKGITNYCIKSALKHIDSDGYLTTLEKLATKKLAAMEKEDNRVKYFKLQSYLLQKGYENELIKQAINKLKNEPLS
jgi:regulatory protein